jgi:RimJ/RimL family protein N-acetyltransferase
MRVVRDLKAPDDRSALAIRSPDGRSPGALVPVTELTATNDEIVAAMARWRSVHRDAFLTVFESTTDKTRGYIRKILLPDPTRILFLVREAATDAVVGNLGLNNISTARAELDNVLRGEAVTRRDMMHLAMLALLNWAFGSLAVTSVSLNVLGHNLRAMRAYRRVGFVEISRVPLSRHATEDGFRLVPATESAVGELTGLELATMELTRAAFYGSHQWIDSVP